MNWSRSAVTFSSGGVRAHPPGVAPEASVEYFDSSEVFYTLYLGNVLRSWRVPSFVRGLALCGRAPEPRAREVDQSLGRLLSFDPHAPFLEKGRRGRERRTTLVWVSSNSLR
jgi:hypothetical protein